MRERTTTDGQLGQALQPRTCRDGREHGGWTRINTDLTGANRGNGVLCDLGVSAFRFAGQKSVFIREIRVKHFRFSFF
jgi:hypothetical protein